MPLAKTWRPFPSGSNTSTSARLRSSLSPSATFEPEPTDTNICVPSFENATSRVQWPPARRSERALSSRGHRARSCRHVRRESGRRHWSLRRRPTSGRGQGDRTRCRRVDPDPSANTSFFPLRVPHRLRGAHAPCRPGSRLRTDRLTAIRAAAEDRRGHGRRRPRESLAVKRGERPVLARRRPGRSERTAWRTAAGGRRP
jgi:hypothetical protein